MVFVFAEGARGEVGAAWFKGVMQVASYALIV